MARVVAALAAVAVLAALGAAGWAWWTGRGAVKQLAHAEQQAGDQTVATGQAKAATSALRITVAAEARDRATAAIATENAHALLQSPGAAAPVDPALLERLNAGLCLYAATRDDPGCAGLRQPDPEQLP